MITCIFDFVVAPILWSLTQSLFHGSVQTQWQPLTLQGAGLYHIAMGAVLGIAAYGRTQEKLGGANNGGINLSSNVGTTYAPPSAVQQPAASAVSVPTTTAIAPVPSWETPPTAPAGFGNDFGAPATVTTGFGGKPAPVIPPFPER
jgi:hypothetical protein